MKQNKMTGNKAFQRNNAHWKRIDERRQQILNEKVLEKELGIMYQKIVKE